MVKYLMIVIAFLLVGCDNRIPSHGQYGSAADRDRFQADYEKGSPKVTPGFVEEWTAKATWKPKAEYQAQQPPKTPESVYKIKDLFTHNGCTVTKFYDDGRWRYFTNCKGETTFVERCGKSCTNHVTIPTNITEPKPVKDQAADTVLNVDKK